VTPGQPARSAAHGLRDRVDGDDRPRFGIDALIAGLEAVDRRG